MEPQTNIYTDISGRTKMASLADFLSGRWASVRGPSAKLLVALVPLLCTACDKSSVPTTIGGETMGTYYSVTIADPVEDGRVAFLSTRISEVLDEIDHGMSTYIEDSELSRFNRSRSTEWQNASPQLVTVLLEAKRLYAISNGIFDVTVGPLVDLWGFGSTGGIEETPSVNAINRMLDRIGGHHLEVRASPPMVRKRIPQLSVNLSAIAKGYAVDRVAAALADAGIDNSLVDVGGELYASGVNPDGDAWRIGIENLGEGGNAAAEVIYASDIGVATSGDYRIYTEIAGRRYSHAIDPYSGWPMKHRTVLASVVASSVMEADAWATTMLVLGSDKGIELARQFDLAVYFVIRTHTGLESVLSPAFEVLQDR